jgi:hypothetical protein
VVRQDPPLSLLTCLPPLPGELANQEAADQQDARTKYPESQAAARAGKKAPYPVATRREPNHTSRSRRPRAARRLCKGLRGPGEGTPPRPSGLTEALTAPLVALQVLLRAAVSRW